ncbi:hypothetical protein C8F01DRAFT_1252621 [Mycena amicta]|nr:hypothetical protein C8F01DRAFT_1252621 [Mycena amicta]
MPATTTAKDHLDVLRKSLKKSTPYTSGVLQVRSEDLVLFHKSGDGEREANGDCEGAGMGGGRACEGGAGLGRAGAEQGSDARVRSKARTREPMSIAYIAFFSDVTHAVEEVVSGYRVTLTYNLFLANRPASRLLPARRSSPAEAACDKALRALLADTKFLPAGGLLAFGLEHEYPVPRTPRDPQTLGYVLRILKGADARMQSVASRVRLQTTVKLVYQSQEYDYGDKVYGGNSVALGAVVDLEDLCEDDMNWVDPDVDDGDSDASVDERTPVYWVTKLGRGNLAESAYVAMGNEASLGHSYGNAALFMRFPPAKARK